MDTEQSQPFKPVTKYVTSDNVEHSTVEEAEKYVQENILNLIKTLITTAITETAPTSAEDRTKIVSEYLLSHRKELLDSLNTEHAFPFEDK